MPPYEPRPRSPVPRVPTPIPGSDKFEIDIETDPFLETPPKTSEKLRALLQGYSPAPVKPILSLEQLSSLRPGYKIIAADTPLLRMQYANIGMIGPKASTDNCLQLGKEYTIEKVEGLSIKVKEINAWWGHEWFWKPDYVK